jgi:hypothetical protein
MKKVNFIFANFSQLISYLFSGLNLSNIQIKYQNQKKMKKNHSEYNPSGRDGSENGQKPA